MNAFSRKTIILTGANRGIGYEIAKSIYNQDYQSRLIMACRNLKAGEEALKSLKNSSQKDNCELFLEELDLLNPESIQQFVENIKKKYIKFDALINNGMFATPNDIFYSDKRIIPLVDREHTILTGYTNTAFLTEQLLPYLSDDGKIIMVSSYLGKLQFQGDNISKLFQDPEIKKETLDSLADDFLEAAKDNKQDIIGYNKSAYALTKALLNCYSRFILRKKMKDTQQLYVLTPGWCKTCMGTDKALNSPEYGSITPMYLLNLPYVYNPNLDAKFYEDKAFLDYV